MRLYLVRHGETPWNVEHRIQGISDVDLNENGVKLAKLTGQVIKGIPFDCAYASPLKRALRTGEMMLGKRDVSIQLDERLAEANFGEAEAMLYQDAVNTNHPIMNFFERPWVLERAPKAESPLDVMNRGKDFLENVAMKQQDDFEHMAVFTHGAMIQGMLTYIYGWGVEDFQKVPRLGNCSVTIVDVEKERFHVVEEGKIFASLPNA